MMRKDATPDWITIVVGLHYNSGYFVAKHVRDLVVHVPIHQFARAESAGFCFDEEAAFRQARHGLIRDEKVAFSCIASELHEVVVIGVSSLASLRVERALTPSFS
jgi:hypothetical protein